MSGLFKSVRGGEKRGVRRMAGTPRHWRGCGNQTKARCSCRALSPLMLPAQRWQMACVGLTSGS